MSYIINPDFSKKLKDRSLLDDLSSSLSSISPSGVATVAPESSELVEEKTQNQAPDSSAPQRKKEKYKIDKMKSWPISIQHLPTVRFIRCDF